MSSLHMRGRFSLIVKGSPIYSDLLYAQPKYVNTITYYNEYKIFLGLLGL